jgi:hypothetical protein
MKRLCATMAVLLLSGGLAAAQGVGGGAGAGGAGGTAGSGAGGATIPSGTPSPSNGATVGQAPGTNPSNLQDQTNRGNPQDLSKPGGSNPQDLKR